MFTIALAAAKGGVGKTTLTAALAADAVNTYPVALPGFYSLSFTCVASFSLDGSIADPCVLTDASAPDGDGAGGCPGAASGGSLCKGTAEQTGAEKREL